jgi:hypothetical protein
VIKLLGTLHFMDFIFEVLYVLLQLSDLGAWIDCIDCIYCKKSYNV